MKYVTVPEPVIIYTDATKKHPVQQQHEDGSKTPLVVSLRNFLEMFVINDKQFSQNIKAIKAGVDLMGETQDAQPGDVLKLRDYEVGLVKEVLNSPSQPFNAPGILRQCLCFADAFLEAKDVDPKDLQAAAQ